MNPTTTLLGATGLLLVVALLFSLGRLNSERQARPDEIAELRREIRKLNEERARLRSNNLTYLSTSNFPPSPVEPTKPVAESTLEELEKYRRENERLRNELASNVAPAPEPEPEPIAEEPAEPDTNPTEEASSAKRARLIRQAILQANVQQWDNEYGMAVIEPTPSANFSVGDELGLRRNGGILCKLRVSREVQGQYIADLVHALGGEIPDVKVGDELIIPPVFDGKLDF